MKLKSIAAVCSLVMLSSFAFAETIHTSVSDGIDQGPGYSSGYYGGASVPMQAGPRFRWEAYRGYIPVNAVIGGGERGRIVYICQTDFSRGTHPGKLVNGRCHITFAGDEIVTDRFSILVGKRLRWVFADNRSMPGDAISGGHEPNRELYICRGSYRGNVFPGKIVDGSCNIGYAGREIQLSNYEVLVGMTPGPRARVYNR